LYRRLSLGVVLVVFLSGVLSITSLSPTFEVLGVNAFEVIYIMADGSVKPSKMPIRSTDNITYVFTDNIDAFITIERSSIIIDGNGYVLRGDGTGNGFSLYTPSNVTIRNVQIKNFGYGIYMDNPSSITISGNIMTDNGYGINFYRCSNNNIQGNTIMNGDVGISLSYSSNYNTIRENNLTDNQLAGIELWTGSHDNTVERNSISGTNSTNAPGIILSNASNNDISKNNARNNYNGMIISSYSTNNTVCENNVTDNEYYGVYVYRASGNRILKNNIARNKVYGIDLRLTSNCTICGNNIASNTEGVGIWFSSNNNTIHHNNFVGNTMHVSFHALNCYEIWDDGIEGNYWSDYMGADSKRVGIGDAPYFINANNADHYPLMGIFYDFDVVVEHGQVYDVQAISNSSVQDLAVFWWSSSSNYYLQLGQKYINFSIVGEEGTTGFCRMVIPRNVLNGSYVVLVDWQEVQVNELTVSNRTHAYLYFTYTHSKHEVLIMPEITSAMIIAFLVATASLTAMLSRRWRNWLISRVGEEDMQTR
jgi:parallel beta-helix repeat protein